MAHAKKPLWVHIGALRDESLALIQQAQADQTVIVASLGQDEASVKALSKSVSAYHLAEHPITPQGGEAVLYQYNLPELNSLAPATGLKALYPGLKETQQVTLETQPLAAALKAHQLEDASITHLVLEQPESTLALLQSLEAQGHLYSLQRLWVRTSEEALYEGMPNQAALQASCAELGFELEDTLADDPDFILLEYTRNPLYTQLKAQQEKADRLEQQRNQLQKACDEQTAAKDKAQAEVDQLKKQRDEQAVAKDKALAEVDQLKKQRNEQAAAKDKAQVEIEQLKKQRDEQAAAKDKAQAEVDQLKKQRDDQTAAKDKVQAEVAQLKQERDKLNKQQETLRQQLREQQQENQQLREEVKATDERQNKLNIELERAEAQLELIKDLLLKDRLLSND